MLWSSNCIDKYEELESKIPKLTYEDIQWRYGTFRTQTERTPQGKKIYSRHGVATGIGDIEVQAWYQLAHKMIELAGELELLKNLQEFLWNEYRWWKEKKECEQYALQLHISRIFDQPEWVEYIRFNQRYRPEKIKN